MTISSVLLPERAAMPEAPPAIAADIAGRLAAAEQELADLEAQLPEASLAKELDEKGAAERLTELDVAIRAASRKVERLRLSHNAALARDAAAANKLRHDFRLSTVKDFEAFCAQRLEAAKVLAAGIAQAAEAFRSYIEISQNLPLIVPLDVHFENHELMLIGETPPNVLVAREMFRLGATIDAQGIATGAFALPGASPFDLSNGNNPAALPPLVETVQANTAAVLSIVRDRVAALA